jgi:hypothetical protein
VKLQNFIEISGELQIFIEFQVKLQIIEIIEFSSEITNFN